MDVCQRYVDFTVIIARSSWSSLCKSPVPEINNNFWVTFHREFGSFLIFIACVIAWHNYNLGLRKGFGMNWINLAAKSCACMLIRSTPPLKIWFNTPIIHLSRTEKLHDRGGIRFDDSGAEKWRKKKENTHSYLFRFECFFIFFIYLPSYFSLSLDCSPSHIGTHTYRGRAADPVPLCAPPTCSRGHGWLKQWQVDSTLKLSIDHQELNQTANPQSLSARASSGLSSP